jgi:nicotinate phosphoribosyltransferase
MIINSLLDSDLYKFTMQQLVYHKFPNARVVYHFKLRNGDKLLGSLSDHFTEIRKEVSHLCRLKFTDDELIYLSSLPFISKDYVDALKKFQLERNNIDIIPTYDDDQLEIYIHGTWFDTILFEVPVLAIISEIYTRKIAIPKMDLGMDKIAIIRNDAINEKLKLLRKSNIQFTDFGTRRRASGAWHDHLINILTHHSDKISKQFIGTSNVMLAKKYGITPVGTMAHEFLQAMQAFTNITNSQKMAWQVWADEYKGKLGIALSDTLGMKPFLHDFDGYYARLYDGARQDSGDPYDWTNALLERYEQLGIDPKTKTVIYSDGLNIEKCIKLQNTFGDKINVKFGIGTNLTNDCGFVAPQIVIKMTECNGQPVAKVSDSPGKEMCRSPEYQRFVQDMIRNWGEI